MTNPLAHYYQGPADIARPESLSVFHIDGRWSPVRERVSTRLKERKAGRDKGPAPRGFLRQLKAITAWGRQAPQDLGSIRIPMLIANGDQDKMVPSSNTYDLARHIPGLQLVIYEDAGHGGIFQNHADFVRRALAFLGA